MSSKSVLQECQVRVFYKSGLQECQVRSVVEDCSICNIKQECVVIRVSRKSVTSECLTRVSLLSVTDECLTRGSSRRSPDLPSETVSMKFDGMYFLGFSRMRSEGSRFTWGSGGEAVFAKFCVCDRNRSQPSATVRGTAVKLSTVASASGVVQKACQVDYLSPQLYWCLQRRCLCE